MITSKVCDTQNETCHLSDFYTTQTRYATIHTWYNISQEYEYRLCTYIQRQHIHAHFSLQERWLKGGDTQYSPALIFPSGVKTIFRLYQRDVMNDIL